ncbi:LADA_0C01794g1_1 [Lachancea dasiensis]|uniref:LADA_0C01794g1_1 n=1 Tax=Lachancea dasiensis TaxID=1072105 RepID=A0A1G4IY89_9SACH|nr:LADA_0C01794g1_1 [Lachancea dasiensis]
MLKESVLVLYVSSLASVGVARMSLSQPQLSFACPPLKAHEIDGQNWRDKASCIDFETHASKSPLIISITASDFLDHQVDLNRFGPTSCERGKQSLDLVIAAKNGDILRSVHNLKSGSNFIQLQSTTPSSYVSMCFLNLVYDGSWRSIDSHKAVTLALLKDQTAQPGALDDFTKEMCDNMLESADLLFSLVDNQSGQQLFLWEHERRDLNESTFSWLFTAQLIHLVSLIVASWLVVRYARASQKAASLTGKTS